MGGRECSGQGIAARAGAEGFVDVGTAWEMGERADVILSICPPHAALDTAWAVQGFGGLYVDANAISPATAREVALMVEEGGATYIDGGIIGLPPPASPSPFMAGSTRPYLAGAEAHAVRRPFDGTSVDPP